MNVRILTGDCLDVMPTLAACSVDSIVTDPPYHLTTGKPGGTGAASDNPNSPAGRARIGTGFMGKAWDGGDLAHRPEVWREALRVAKPGAHLLAFGGTRTFHRLMVAIEDAGWEIRDTIMWVYGSGFPKSLDVSKAIDSRKDWGALRLLQTKVRTAREMAGISQSEAARRMGLIAEGETLGGGGFMWFETGMRLPTRDQYPKLKAALSIDDSCDDAFEAAEREVIGTHKATAAGQNMRHGIGGGDEPLPPGDITVAATEAAKQWDGWGTALKPAWEPIIVARKPLAGTVAENVQRFGTGALNIDASRIGTNGERVPYFVNEGGMKFNVAGPTPQNKVGGHTEAGRWPANLIHDGSDEVVALFPAEAGAFAPVRGTEPSRPEKNTYGEYARGGGAFHDDIGSAARFFKECKFSEGDEWQRNNDRHARDAGILSDSCGTSIAAVHAETRNLDFRSEELPVIPNSIGNSNGSIQPHNPASPVAAKENTDTTATTASLLKSSGYVPPVTDGSIKPESLVINGSSGVRRFVYCPKADREDRTDGNTHPTVKPESLMAYLVRLVTPPGGTVLDPFAGSGSTGLAADRLQFNAILIELDPAYAAIAEQRIRGDAPLFAQMAAD